MYGIAEGHLHQQIMRVVRRDSPKFAEAKTQ
jgi:hypothetical protein